MEVPLFTMNEGQCKVFDFTQVETVEQAEEIRSECQSLSSSNWWTGVAYKVAQFAVLFITGYGLGLLSAAVGVPMSTAISLCLVGLFFESLDTVWVGCSAICAVVIPYIGLRIASNEYLAKATHYTGQAQNANNRIEELRGRLESLPAQVV